MPFLVHTGKPYLVADGTEFVLGRHRECGIQIADEKSSRKHARIFHLDGSWMVEDLASANGTKLNGRALITGPAKLTDGDVISIGAAEIRYQLDAEPRAASKPLPEDDAELVGREIGGHRLDRFIGRGLTGPVFRAWSAARNRHVVFKALDRRLLADVEFPARFQRDLTLAAGIEHPAVVRILQCARSDGMLWYTMELVEGESLAQRIQDRSPPAEALAVTIALGKALQAYHEAGLVHGDIKPASILFDAKKQVRLLDIGLIGLTNAESRLMQADGNTRQVFYLCPAQARGGQCNVRSDIYSVGCILHQLLTGRPPYVGNSFEEVVVAHERQPIPVISGSLNLPAKIDDVLGGMLHKDPFFRYDSIGYAIDELAEIQGTLA